MTVGILPVPSRSQVRSWCFTTDSCTSEGEITATSGAVQSPFAILMRRPAGLGPVPLTKGFLAVMASRTKLALQLPGEIAAAILTWALVAESLVTARASARLKRDEPRESRRSLSRRRSRHGGTVYA